MYTGCSVNAIVVEYKQKEMVYTKTGLNKKFFYCLNVLNPYFNLNKAEIIIKKKNKLPVLIC